MNKGKANGGDEHEAEKNDTSAEDRVEFSEELAIVDGRVGKL